MRFLTKSILRFYLVPMKNLMGICVVLLSLFGLQQQAWGWGAIRGVAPTHNDIVKIAYGFIKTNDPYALEKLPPLQTVLDNDYVEVVGGQGALKGPGPDCEGQSDYSKHYYNPENPKKLRGKGPSAVAQYFEDALFHNFGQNHRYTIGKSLAWASHFLADMNVPYHVVGIPASEVYKNGFNPVLDLSVSGEDFLYSLTDKDIGGRHFLSLLQNEHISVKDLLYSLTERYAQYDAPPEGWGRRQNFSEAVQTFKKHYPNTKNNHGDWFDPWYLNGMSADLVPLITENAASLSVFEALGLADIARSSFADQAQIIGGSHAFWEFWAARTVKIDEVEARLAEFSHNGNRYHHSWIRNVPAGWGENFSVPTKGKMEQFTQKIAQKTRLLLHDYWLYPKEAIANAAWAVATMLRASVSGIQVAKPTYLKNEHEGGMLVFPVTNRSKHNVSILKARLSFDGEVYEERTVKGIELAEGERQELEFDLHPPGKIYRSGVIEISGNYTTVPDIGYGKCKFEFDPAFAGGVGPDEEQENINTFDSAKIQTSEIRLRAMRSDGPECRRFAWGDTIYAAVDQKLLDDHHDTELVGQWELRSASGKTYPLTSKPLGLSSSRGSREMALSINVQNHTDLGAWDLSLDTFMDGALSSKRSTDFEVVPLFSDFGMWIKKKDSMTLGTTRLRPGDPAVIHILGTYNGHNSEKTSLLKLSATGKDMRITEMDDEKSYHFDPQQLVLDIPRSIPKFIKEGMYEISVKLECDKSEVTLNKSLEIDYPVNFSRIYLTEGATGSVTNHFKAGDDAQFKMDFEFVNIDTGDRFATRFLCFYNGQVVQALSAGLSGENDVGAFANKVTTRCPVNFGKNAKTGKYELQGIVAVNGIAYSSGKTMFYLDKEPAAVPDQDPLPDRSPHETDLKKGDCPDPGRSYRLYNGKSYTIRNLELQLDKATAGMNSYREKIANGVLRFHGVVPPKSNYPISKKEYLKKIEEKEGKMNKLLSLGDKATLSISRAPTSGVWGYAKFKLLEKQADARKRLAGKLSGTWREHYTKTVARCDVLIGRWEKKRASLLQKHRADIAYYKNMILLWEKTADERLREKIEERQQILDLINAHPCS